MGPDAGDLIKDTDTQNFMADVIEASKAQPVIVDFWATWCGPCKQLGPMLEKAVRHAGGLVKMVKVNVDENQELAAQMRVQSIPAVYAFKDGQPVDGFAGAQPESQIKAFIERLTGGAKAPVDQMIEEAAAALDAGAIEQAHAAYAAVLEAEPTNPAALGGLIRVATAMGDLAGARAIADGLTADILVKSEVAGAIAALELEEAGGAAEGADAEALRAALEKNENDHQARFDLAMALYGAGQIEEAMDQLIEIVRRDKGWNDEAARQQMVQFFEALGPTHEQTLAGRRKLSAVLFA
jgi:putative thioredoxin